MLYYTILYYTVLYYTILYYTILYETIRNYTILYYTPYRILICMDLAGWFSDSIVRVSGASQVWVWAQDAFGKKQFRASCLESEQEGH